MKSQYSTQQLNQNLPEVLKQIQQGNAIEITQDGEPFAVILSSLEYERLISPKSSFWESLQNFRSSQDLEELETETDAFADVRDRS
ncbi:MAG: type II toxin-antitoxin system prevent-host-death family antitoxin [Cyanobacteria bacterium P01_A01_bin.84]